MEYQMKSIWHWVHTVSGKQKTMTILTAYHKYRVMMPIIQAQLAREWYRYMDLAGEGSPNNPYALKTCCVIW